VRQIAPVVKRTVPGIGEKMGIGLSARNRT